MLGYYKDSRHRNRRAHEPQKDQFIYKQTLTKKHPTEVKLYPSPADEGALLTCQQEATLAWTSIVHRGPGAGPLRQLAVWFGCVAGPLPRVRFERLTPNLQMLNMSFPLLRPVLRRGFFALKLLAKPL